MFASAVVALEAAAAQLAGLAADDRADHLALDQRLPSVKRLKIRPSVSPEAIRYASRRHRSLVGKCQPFVYDVSR